MKRVLMAGGLCGTTMLIASDKIKAQCMERGVAVETSIQNLWETSYVRPDYDLIVEMFPFFTEERCPIISGKPFINHIGEKNLLEQIADCLCKGKEKSA